MRDMYEAHATGMGFYMHSCIGFLTANKLQSQDLTQGLLHSISSFHHFSRPPVILWPHSTTGLPLGTLSEINIIIDTDLEVLKIWTRKTL